MGRIGLVQTVRNEERILPHNVRYHAWLGVERFYVYLDACTDGTEAAVRDLPGVRVAPTVAPGGFVDRPEARLFVEQHEAIHTARQCLNALDAIQRARAEGLDWLVHIDADELLCVAPHRPQRDQLRLLLDGIEGRFEAVRFRVYEACPRREDYAHPFSETLFWRPGARVLHRFPDPLRNGSLLVRGLLGHRVGKMAVRTRADAVPYNVHRFLRRDGSDLRSVWTPYLLHFYVAGFSRFLTKFRNLDNRSDAYLYGGRIPRYVSMWRDMVNGSAFSQCDLRRYYVEHVVLDAAEVRRHQRTSLLRGWPPLGTPLESITSVQSVMNGLA